MYSEVLTIQQSISDWAKQTSVNLRVVLPNRTELSFERIPIDSILSLDVGAQK